MTVAEGTRLAVLIDADNATASVMKGLLEEVARLGTASVRRAYGDWTTQNLSGWKEHLHRHAIQPVQQFSYTTGKNATDSALIIDAMDLLHMGNVEGFCLVSSDSDFTRLATRLREAGKVVYGVGERKTPEAFRAACNRFIFFEVPKQPATIDTGYSERLDAMGLRAQLTQAIAAAMCRDDGWSPLSAVGSQIAKNNPSFDARLHGYSKLGELVRQQPYLEVMDLASNSGTVQTCVRIRLGVRDATRGKVCIQLD